MPMYNLEHSKPKKPLQLFRHNLRGITTHPLPFWTLNESWQWGQQCSDMYTGCVHSHYGY